MTRRKSSEAGHALSEPSGNYTADLRRNLLKPWLNLMFPKQASGSIGLLLRCISPRSLVSSAFAALLYEFALWLTSIDLQSRLPV